MKYINQLEDADIIEMAKGYAWGTFKELVSVNKFEDRIEVLLISECEDDEPECEGEMITLEDAFTFYDYDFKIWDYQANNKPHMTAVYREKLLKRFGEQYAIDYLLQGM